MTVPVAPVPSESAVELCRVLPWDSAFFGIRIARVVSTRLDQSGTAEAVAWCRREGVGRLFFLADAGDLESVRAVQGAGFRLVDIRVTLEWSASQEPSETVAAGLTTRLAREEDLFALCRIASKNHGDSRFYQDGGFPRELCDELFATWIAKSVRGEAQAVFVVEAGSGPAGYVTCHRDGPSTGRIGLFGVGESARGRGAGAALVAAAQSWFRAELQPGASGPARVTVATQGRNLAAQRLYQRCGFVTRAVQLWYHFGPA